MHNSLCFQIHNPFWLCSVSGKAFREQRRYRDRDQRAYHIDVSFVRPCEVSLAVETGKDVSYNVSWNESRTITMSAPFWSRPMHGIASMTTPVPNSAGFDSRGENDQDALLALIDGKTGR